MSHEHFKHVSSEKWREVRTESACVFVKRSRTARISIRMGVDHMVLEASAERFVFRARTGPLCPSESSKMQLCGHRDKAETVIGTVPTRVFDVCATKVMDPMKHV